MIKFNCLDNVINILINYNFLNEEIKRLKFGFNAKIYHRIGD